MHYLILVSVVREMPMGTYTRATPPTQMIRGGKMGERFWRGDWEGAVGDGTYDSVLSD